jgi:MPBQ/MSBQ methyltransferase
MTSIPNATTPELTSCAAAPGTAGSDALANALNALIDAHYHVDDLAGVIREALAAAGKPLAAVAADDLAPVDAFHMRGRQATAELAALVISRPGRRVLDIGCGIGGTARYLAAHHGCDVTGVDLTESFCRVATELSAWVGLGESTRFRRASALELPFHDETFDVVWTEHVQMNVADKRRFYAEATRVLRPGGRLAFHDIFRGPTAEPYYPTPWADDASLSFLCTPAEARATLGELGLSALHWSDRSEEAERYFATILAKIKEQGPPPVGLHLIIARQAPEKLANLHRNLEERRIVGVQAVLTR